MLFSFTHRMGVVGSETEGNLVNVKFSIFLLLVSSLFIMRSLILLSKERAILYPLRYLEVSFNFSSVRHFLSCFSEAHRSQLKHSSLLYILYLKQNVNHTHFLAHFFFPSLEALTTFRSHRARCTFQFPHRTLTIAMKRHLFAF